MPTSPHTAVPAFKKALYRQLGAKLSGKQVSYRWPGEQTELEGVYLADYRCEQAIANVDNTVRKKRDERFELDIVAQSFIPNDNTPEAAMDADDRLAVLTVAIENVLSDDVTVHDPTTSGPGPYTHDAEGTVQWAYLGRTESTTFDTANGVAIRAVCTVIAQARLT